MAFFKKIIINKIENYENYNLNQKLQAFSKSLGLFTERDKERSCFRMFILLLKATKKDEPMTSDELAYKLNLSRGTVIHHLNKLIDAGIANSKYNKYLLRTSSLSELVNLIKKDVCDEIKKIDNLAKELDKKI